MVIPIGERVIDFKGIITLNELGQFIWDKLYEETSYEDLLHSILSEYDVSEESARPDLDIFLEDARRLGVLEI